MKDGVKVVAENMRKRKLEEEIQGMNETYKILTEISKPDLEDRVNEHLQKGWIPIGGVSVMEVDDNYGTTDILYVQAIYFDKPKVLWLSQNNNSEITG